MRWLIVKKGKNAHVINIDTITHVGMVNRGSLTKVTVENPDVVVEFELDKNAVDLLMAVLLSPPERPDAYVVENGKIELYKGQLFGADEQ